MTTETRATATVDFLGRDVQVYEMSDTQKAVLAQLAKSSRVELITKIARLVDLIESLFVEEADREWFADNMLGGEWDFVEDVMPQVEAIAAAFNPQNRQTRRATKKAAAKRPARGAAA
jgi:hypothetical protein